MRNDCRDILAFETAALFDRERHAENGMVREEVKFWRGLDYSVRALCIVDRLLEAIFHDRVQDRVHFLDAVDVRANHLLRSHLQLNGKDLADRGL